MAKLNLMGAALIMAGAPLVASCAPAGSGEPGAAALTPKQAERLDKQLAGKIPGEPVKCLPSYRSTDTIRVSDSILLYRSGRNIVYRNDLKSSCPGLARDSDIMVVRPIRIVDMQRRFLPPGRPVEAASAARRAFSANSSPIANRRGTKAEPAFSRRRGPVCAELFGSHPRLLYQLKAAP